jgi:flavin reductase (DIM6/NTAB) family NADH-FMN oxidoreductase RutF
VEKSNMTQAFEPDDATAAIDAKTFWRLLGSRPVAVPVVASRDVDGPAGLLALSATHVAAAPPTMLVSIGKSTSALKTIKASGFFSINYLPEEASETADIFGGKRGLSGAERFAAGLWDVLTTGSPVFGDAVAVFDCAVDRVFDYHDTELVIGRIVGYKIDDVRRPLLSQSGKYTGLRIDAAA